MEFRELIRRAMDIRAQYALLDEKASGRNWTGEEVALGFVGDV